VESVGYTGQTENVAAARRFPIRSRFASITVVLAVAFSLMPGTIVAVPTQAATSLSRGSATKVLNEALTAGAIGRVVRTAIGGAGQVPGLSVGVGQGRSA
jgi:hypothetical protein